MILNCLNPILTALLLACIFIQLQMDFIEITLRLALLIKSRNHLLVLLFQNILLQNVFIMAFTEDIWD